MPKFAAIPMLAAAWLLLVSAIDPYAVAATDPSLQQPAIVQPLASPEPPSPPTVQQALQNGVVIVVSKASQRMHVFQDGEYWGSSPVSTGRRGKATPAGVFPILQKKVFHRSNLYSNAPMPFMQRLTWSGIAIHAGYLPGYPASHGCIRLPRAFAKALFGLTRTTNSAVVIANDPLPSARAALFLASNTFTPAERAVRLARADGIAPSVRIAYPPYPAAQPQPTGTWSPATLQQVPDGGQIIQLAAAPTPEEAMLHWRQLLLYRPELAQMRQTIVPAMVGSRQVYRLRAAGPGAYALCSGLKRAGIDCFRVV